MVLAAEHADGNNMDTSLEKEKVFQNFYLTNHWDSNESRSGLGSTLEFTKNIRKFLVEFIQMQGIKKMFDTSCGDWNWMKEISHQLCEYTGMDIVPEVIKRNKELYGNDYISFIQGDFLPFLQCKKDKTYDLILYRHTLEHLPTEYNEQFLVECCRVCQYLLVTTHKLVTNNQTLPSSVYRPVNLDLPPYVNLMRAYFKKEIYDGPNRLLRPEMYLYLYSFE